MVDSEVIWPAYIKYGDAAELVFVSDELEWKVDADLSALRYEQGDFLVDSVGNTFALDEMEDEHVCLTIRQVKLGNTEITQMIRDHFSTLGECCVAKISPRTIEECMRILRVDKDS